MKKLVVEGSRYGTLQVKALAPKEQWKYIDKGHAERCWVCICDCGAEVLVRRSTLVNTKNPKCNNPHPPKCLKCGETNSDNFYPRSVGECKKCAIERTNLAASKLSGYHLFIRYKITLEQYETLLKKQGGTCALCGEPPDNNPLSVDHDHSCCPTDRCCGKCIRGLVHRRCNTLIGMADDSVDKLTRAIAYLNQHQHQQAQ
jgi:hypothetical protein